MPYVSEALEKSEQWFSLQSNFASYTHVFTQQEIHLIHLATSSYSTSSEARQAILNTAWQPASLR